MSTDSDMELVWNGGDVHLPRATDFALMVAARPDSGYCAARQPTWERAMRVAEALVSHADTLGIRLRIRRQHRSGLWAIYAEVVP